MNQTSDAAAEPAADAAAGNAAVSVVDPGKADDVGELKEVADAVRGHVDRRDSVVCALFRQLQSKN